MNAGHPASEQAVLESERAVTACHQPAEAAPDTLPTSVSRRPLSHRVLSVRLNDERQAILQRYQHVLADRLQRPVSPAEAVYFALDEDGLRRAIDHAAARAELLRTPTKSLYRMRKHWETRHTLSAEEWDLLADYLQVSADAELQEPLVREPRLPSRASYLILLDVFEAIYEHRREYASAHVWAYFAHLQGYATPVRLSDTDTDQRHQAVLHQVARHRDGLRKSDRWEPPGALGRCIQIAMRGEGVDSLTLDRLVEPFWPTLWGLAARGHWIRHRRPVRRPTRHDSRLSPAADLPSVPHPLTCCGVTLTCTAAAGPDLVAQVDVRRVTWRLCHYPELAEFGAMLRAGDEQPWNGRYFQSTRSGSGESATHTLFLKSPEVEVEMSAAEWQALRDLVRQAHQDPDFQRWMHRLEREYGEHG